MLTLLSVHDIYHNSLYFYHILYQLAVSKYILYFFFIPFSGHFGDSGSLPLYVK